MSKPTPGKPDPKSPAADEAAPISAGKVRVIAQSKTHRVLEDDLRRWKEPLE